MKTPSSSQEIGKILREQLRLLGNWLKPTPTDPLLLRIGKTLLKLPVLLFILLLSPVLLLIVGVIFLVAI